VLGRTGGPLVDRCSGQEARSATNCSRAYASTRTNDPWVAGEEAQLRRSAAAWLFFQCGGADEADVKRARPVAWLDHLEREHDNLRAALSWGARIGPTDRTPHCRCNIALLAMCGYFAEGRQWLEVCWSVHRVAAWPGHMLWPPTANWPGDKARLRNARAIRSRALAISRDRRPGRSGRVPRASWIDDCTARRVQVGRSHMREALDVFVPSPIGGRWLDAGTIGMFSATVSQFDQAKECLEAGLATCVSSGPVWDRTCAQQSRPAGPCARRPWTSDSLLEESLTLFRAAPDKASWPGPSIASVMSPGCAETFSGPRNVARISHASSRTGRCTADLHGLAFLGILAAQQANWTVSVRLISAAATMHASILPALAG